MDNLSSADRKKNMTNIRSTGSRSTELRLRSSLAGAGISGFTLNDSNLPGKPDFVFLKEQVVVFVDGCFWHGCPKCYKRPKSNQDYWDRKNKANKRRDLRVGASLKEDGWTVLRIWEHQLKDVASVRSEIQDYL